MKSSTARTIRREAKRIGLSQDALIAAALRGWVMLTTEQRAHALRVGGSTKLGSKDAA